MNSAPKYLIPNNQQITAEAMAIGVTPAKHAVNLGMEPENLPACLWPEINYNELDLDGYVNVQLCGERQDMFSRYVRNISENVQFPQSSVFIHGLGVVASAMARNFSFEYGGGQAPVNLYVVTSQPPSSGKSGANEYLSDPVKAAFETLNKKTAGVRRQKAEKLTELKEMLKKATNKNEIEQLNYDVAQIEEFLDENPIYEVCISDSTPEALEALALSQKGYFSFVADEMSGFNTLLGITYSDGKGLGNANILLSGYDGGYLSTARIKRGNASGKVRGGVAVIAQDLTIDALIEAGAKGNGLAERFLILREKPLLGFRDFSKAPVSIDYNLMAEYSNLMQKIVNHDDVVFKFSSEAEAFIRSVRAMHEPKLRQGGEYEHNLLRGTIGKMDKQVKKIACVLHVLTKWCGSEEPRMIDIETTMWAMSIFDGMFQQFIAAVSNQGAAGSDAYMQKVISVIERKLERGNRMPASRKIKLNDLRGLLKNSKPFSGLQNITSTLKDKVLPALEEKGFIVVHEGVVHVSPKL